MPKPAKEDTNAELRRLARNVLYLVRNVRRDLKIHQLAVLLLVQNSTMPLSVKDLATMLKFSKTSVTRAIDRLQSDGLVTREVSLVDRRLVEVQLLVGGADYIRKFQD